MGGVKDLQGALTVSRAHSLHNTPELLGVAGRDPELQNGLLQGLCPGEWPHTRADTAPQICTAPNPLGTELLGALAQHVINVCTHLSVRV